MAGCTTSTSAAPTGNPSYDDRGWHSMDMIAFSDQPSWGGDVDAICFTLSDPQCEGRDTIPPRRQRPPVRGNGDLPWNGADTLMPWKWPQTDKSVRVPQLLVLVGVPEPAELWIPGRAGRRMRRCRRCRGSSRRMVHHPVKVDGSLSGLVARAGLSSLLEPVASSTEPKKNMGLFGFIVLHVFTRCAS